MRLNGAQILIECLLEQGVDNVFGYPGASVLSVYDALKNSPIRHILTAHEQGACFAAEGYARAGDKAGVVLTTSGPGATNLVTGIADAYMDSVPLVAITGNVSLQNLGHDSFQEVDIFDMTMPVTKYSMIIKSADAIADGVRKAFRIAESGRKGPVLIDIPCNVFDEYAEYEKQPPVKAEVITNADVADIERLAEFINAAKRPLIYAGGGVRSADAAEELKDFALKISAPVIVSYMGIGCFDPYDPAYLGVLSDVNSAATAALKECDLVITLGARFNSRYNAFNIIKKRKLPLLQIDADKAEIDKNILTTASVCGDVKDVLKKLIPLLREQENEEWVFFDFEEFKMEHRGADVIRALNSRITPDTVITTDVGLHQVWAAHCLKCPYPKSFITSGGLGAMGFGVGAAIGAHFRRGGRCIVITGDGSFNMNFNEITTAVKHHVPLVVIVMNNNSLGMIRKLQLERKSRQTPASSLYLNVDYAALAAAMGARGLRLDEDGDVEAVLDEAFAQTTPVVIDCRLGINEGI